MAKIKVEVDVEDTTSVPDAAIALQISEVTIWRWIRDHKIPFVKIQGRTLIPNYAIEELKTREPPGRGVLAGTRR